MDIEQELKNYEMVKLAVKEWINGELTDSEAMWIISVNIGVRKPTNEEIIWAMKKLS